MSLYLYFAVLMVLAVVLVVIVPDGSVDCNPLSWSCP